MIPACQDIEHTCPHCILLISYRTNGLGGFLMARYRRGVDHAKVYPVDQEYIPVGQDDYPVNPLPGFSQQTGVTEPVKK